MIIDVNVSLSRWPFRRLRLDDTAELVAFLRRRGVVQAWAGSFEALFHKDVAGVNERLADECRRRGEGILLPFGVVHPKYADWEEDLRRCLEVHRMPGIRLYPNYHGYGLEDPDFARLLGAAAERGLVVQLVLKMEDERTMHPLVRVPAVETAPLANLVAGIPGLRLVVLGGSRDGILQLAPSGASFDFSSLEGLEGVARLAEKIGVERILFGSHSPFFIWEAARLKVTEAGLDASRERAILAENARRLIEGRR
ncbi:MAG TPA: amidohydrolase family protein [Planctomycetota bacterium]|nr:amidohydrolase family protein [Planctomycetota bacterium]